MSENHHEWLNLSDAAALLGVHPSTLRAWSDRGDIPAHRTPGKHRRFRRADIEHWADSRREAHTSPGQLIVENVLGRTRMQMAEGGLAQTRLVPALRRVPPSRAARGRPRPAPPALALPRRRRRRRPARGAAPSAATTTAWAATPACRSRRPSASSSTSATSSTTASSTSTRPPASAPPASGRPCTAALPPLPTPSCSPWSKPKKKPGKEQTCQGSVLARKRPPPPVQEVPAAEVVSHSASAYS